ncbi:MAG: hypothetical protein GEU96_06605 [Propionibacteriales bacterium]|nr:hypothetical protein [Propionibacteriales bacterium]
MTVDEHHHANGRILDQAASFMPMRSHADPTYAALRSNAAPARGARATRITVTDLDSDDARFILGLALPDVATFAVSQPQHGLLLAHHTDHSWSELRADGTVVYGGPRDLWSILETAHQEWSASGFPHATRSSLPQPASARPCDSTAVT